MTKDQFSVLLSSIQSAELQVRKDGQKEYAHDDSNVFANFDRVAAALKLDRKQVLLVYALKHWDGIVSYVGGHVSQREDVRGRIKDLRMYLALLWGMIDEEGIIKPKSTEESRKVYFDDDPDIVSERIFPNGI